MSKRIGAALAASAMLACAGQQGAQGGGAQKPTEERQAARNISYFDLATCFPRKLELPGAVNDAVVVGVLVAARPQVMECLVPQDNRGPAEDTAVTAKATVSTTGTELSVTGENLTAAGETCVREALTKATAELKLAAPEAAKGKTPEAPAPVTAQAEFKHKRDVTPTVTMGVNDSSNVIGAIRLAQTSLCECYADWQNAPPKQLKAAIKVSPSGAAAAPAEGEAAPAGDMVSPTEVTIEQTGDAAADKVAACLQPKLMALKIPKPAGEIQIPGAPLFYIHSGVSEPMDGSPADIRFIQLDALAGQRNADTAIALGARTQAVTVYDGLVQRYKANPQKEWRLVDQLTARCAELVASDDRWIKAVEAQLELDKRTLALITELKATDPAYAEAETKAQARVEQTQKDLEVAQTTKTQDQGVCPKRK